MSFATLVVSYEKIKVDYSLVDPSTSCLFLLTSLFGKINGEIIARPNSTKTKISAPIVVICLEVQIYSYATLFKTNT